MWSVYKKRYGPGPWHSIVIPFGPTPRKSHCVIIIEEFLCCFHSIPHFVIITIPSILLCNSKLEDSNCTRVISKPLFDEIFSSISLF